MAGAADTFTVMVSDNVLVLPEALLAEIVTGKLPVAVGVPAMVAVPLPLSVKASPAGSSPLSPRDGAG